MTLRYPDFKILYIVLSNHQDTNWKLVSSIASGLKNSAWVKWKMRGVKVTTDGSTVWGWKGISARVQEEAMWDTYEIWGDIPMWILRKPEHMKDTSAYHFNLQLQSCVLCLVVFPQTKGFGVRYGHGTASNQGQATSHQREYWMLKMNERVPWLCVEGGRKTPITLLLIIGGPASLSSWQTLTTAAAMTTGEISSNLIGYGLQWKQPVFPPPHLSAHLHKATGATTTTEVKQDRKMTGEWEQLHILLLLCFPSPHLISHLNKATGSNVSAEG